MVEILDQSNPDIIAIRLSGKLLHQDYQQFLPVLEKLIEDRGGIRCLLEMTDFQGMELRALWDEIKFDVKHGRQITRCAVVGDRTWERWMTTLSRPVFPRAEVRFFDVAERDRAWDWIQQSEPASQERAAT